MATNFQAIFQTINLHLEQLPIETTFSLPELYGEDAWKKLYIGDRVMAGNLFRREVLAGHYLGIRLLPTKDRNKRTQYLKYQLQK